MTKPSGRRSGTNRAKWIFTGVVAVVIVVAVGYLTVKLPSTQTTEAHVISGQVRCTSGAGIQGIWIAESARDTGGWADWQPAPGRPDIASYTYRLRDKRYAVNVGCGGTPKDWAIKPQSEYVTGSTNDFACHDRPGKERYLRCVVGR